MENSEPRKTKFLNDKWELHDKIGSGSYGSIYKGLNRETKAQIAIKKFKTSTYNDGIPRDTLKEVIYLRKLNHENVVKYQLK